ncbi:MAG TPA: hypothetical protein VFK41_06410, partial [Nocardioidaceae bacterium]|nr:hypothetical protein [Nocardioidaceae bacterium]
PRVGDAVVTLRVGPSAQGGVDTVRVAGRDPSGLLQRIATRACAVQDVARQVELAFADRWRLERTADGTLAHGRLRARLVAGPARDITQVAGAIMYGLRADEGGGDVPDPLAALTPEQPEASVPVVVWAARCDAHTKGEIKKPYEFLVWVRGPDGEELAVTPGVGEPTRLALRHVCAF